jgi:pentatricopeptide repeat protein
VHVTTKMSTKRLLSNTNFHSIPPIIRNSIQWTHNCQTQSKPPFLPKGPSVLATNLIKSYFERGLIKEARVLFDEMPERDVVTWTAMVAGYTACNRYSHAWTVFVEMVGNGMEPNAFTLSSALKVCKGMKALSCGALVHGLAIKHGVEGSMYVDNALMDMYATCCVSMDEACRVFQDIRAKNAVSWTTLITGYTHRGDGYGGLRVFRQMLQVSS